MTAQTKEDLGMLPGFADGLMKEKRDEETGDGQGFMRAKHGTDRMPGARRSVTGQLWRG